MATGPDETATEKEDHMKTCIAEDCQGWVPWDQGSDYCGRCIVEESTQIPKTVKDRANELLEAWLRGITEGGHIVSPRDISAAYLVMLGRARDEAHDVARDTAHRAAHGTA